MVMHVRPLFVLAACALLTHACGVPAGSLPDPGTDEDVCSSRRCQDVRGESDEDTGDDDVTVDVVDSGTEPEDTETPDDSGEPEAGPDVAPDVPPSPDTETAPDVVVDLRDTDGDGITDAVEGTEDFDEDGIPNNLDTDSDGDGILDANEYRREPGSGRPGSDLDADGSPDFLDLDADGDSLLDSEETGCPDSTDSTQRDTDSDGYLDMVEVAFGSDACDPASDISGLVDFYFELPYEEPPKTDELEIETQLETGDVVFNMDVTGSMSSAISSLRSSLRTTIIPEISSRIGDVGIGVTSFADFPCVPYGGPSDAPFRLRQRVTTDTGDAQRGTDRLSLEGGGDLPESGLESLYQIATGLGRSEPACGGYSTPAFNPSADLEAGVADGSGGGVGFRDSQVRVVVHITDASTQARGEEGVAYGADRTETWAALEAARTKVIGVAIGSNGLFGGSFSSDATGDLVDFARRTGATVPACAWGPVGERPSTCGISQCCTGVDGRGESTTGGTCPLVFKVAGGLFGGGGAIDGSIINGIEALLGGSLFDITPVARRDEEEFAVSGIDTTCFINAIRPLRATPAGCSSAPRPIDTDGDGVLDGFGDVSPGSSVTFELEAQNECVREAAVPQVFLVYIDLITSDGGSLGSRLVTILVPPIGAKI